MRRDVGTGTALTSYKGCACHPGALAALGGDHVVAAQRSRGGPLHFWGWPRDVQAGRCFAPEPLTAVAGSPGGALCAAGGASGAAYLWDTGSGRLLRTWPAHYKARGGVCGVACCATSGVPSVEGGVRGEGGWCVGVPFPHLTPHPSCCISSHMPPAPFMRMYVTAR